MAVRVIMFFGMDGTGAKSYGWSEVHWYLGPAATLDAVKAPAINLANARVNLLGSNGYLKEVRLSDDAVKRDSLILLPVGGGHPTTPGLAMRSTWDLTCDQPNSCLLFKGFNTPSKHRNFYVAGIPDAVVRTAPPGPEMALLGAIGRFNVYSAELCGAPLDTTGLGNQWGYRGRKTAGIVNTPILDWGIEPSPNGRLIAKVSGLAAALAVGQVVQVSGVLMNPPGLPKPIGMWRIASDLGVIDGLRNYVLRGATGFNPLQIDIPGQLIEVAYDYFGYVRISIMGQTTRKRGVGGIRPRGRSSRQLRRLA